MSGEDQIPIVGHRVEKASNLSRQSAPNNTAEKMIQSFSFTPPTSKLQFDPEKNKVAISKGKDHGTIWNHLQMFFVARAMPPKISMEPENHRFGGENHLPNLRFWVACQSSGVYVSFYGVHRQTERERESTLWLKTNINLCRSKKGSQDFSKFWDLCWIFKSFQKPVRQGNLEDASWTMLVMLDQFAAWMSQEVSKWLVSGL